MFAIFAALGAQAQRLEAVDYPHALRVAALLTIPASGALALLFSGGERRRPIAPERPFRAGRAFALILACYAPMFLLTFPGTFAYDVPFQLRQVFTGQYSTHHPLLHTLLLGGCVALGRAVGCINAGAALYTLIQMALLALCFALACASVARSCSARAARRAAACFALYPLHMMMAVNATKDVLFSGCFALTLALLLEAAGRACVGKRLSGGIVLAGALSALLRNNALYAMAAWAVLAALALRGKRRLLAGVLAAALAVGCGANALLASVTHARKGDASEMLSWPIQQLARARSLHEDHLTDEERAAIDALMPGEAWRLYDPTISDPVKFELDTQALFSDVPRYARVYLSVGAKCPQAYADALVLHTYPFFYPYSEYRVSGYYMQFGVSERYYDGWCDFERMSSAFPRVTASLGWRFGAKGAMQVPIIGWAFNMGLIVWTMLYAVLREAYAGRWARFVCALLPVLLWGTFLLGPVMAGRYIYPFVCVLPVLAARPIQQEIPDGVKEE